MNTLGYVPFHPFPLSHNYLGSTVDWFSLQMHMEYQAGGGDPVFLFLCNNTKERAQLLCSFLWRRWKLEGLIIFYPRFGFRKMRHFSFLGRGLGFQPVIFSCQPSTHRMCSQQWEVTGILGIRAICLIWPWVVEAPWCLIKRSSPLLWVSSNSPEADCLY